MLLLLLKFFGGLILLLVIGWIVGKLLHLDKFYNDNDDEHENN
jgi:hypothetical protein